MKCAFNLMDIPDNVPEMFDVWIKRFGKNGKKPHVSWDVLLDHHLRNSVVFDNKRIDSATILVNMVARWLDD